MGGDLSKGLEDEEEGILQSLNQETATPEIDTSNLELKLQAKKVYSLEDYPFWKENEIFYENFKPSLMRIIQNRKREAWEREKGVNEAFQEKKDKWQENIKTMEEERLMKLTQLKEKTKGRPKKIKQETSELYMKNIADIPPLTYITERKYTFYDYNRLIPDLALYAKQKSNEVLWTDKEVRKFIKLFIKHDKDFLSISKGLSNKTTQNCIQFYYLNKYKLKTIIQEEKTKNNGSRISKRLSKKALVDYTESDETAKKRKIKEITNQSENPPKKRKVSKESSCTSDQIVSKIKQLTLKKQ